jgi:hypothetical protein
MRKQRVTKQTTKRGAKRSANVQRPPVTTPAPAAPPTAPPGPRLTRAQVARQLGTSIPTVRRWERRGLLHPTISPVDQARSFDPAEVAAMAPQLARVPREPKPAKTAQAAAPVPTGDPAGELAARVFERFEQRQSLPEVVIGLRITPDKARALFREWNLGLVCGELARREPVLAPSRLSSVDRPTFEGLCAALPLAVPTRISVARDLGVYSLESGEDFHQVQELNGFITHGPLRVDDLSARYGHGSYRVTAIALPEGNLLWEVLTPHI